MHSTTALALATPEPRGRSATRPATTPRRLARLVSGGAAALLALPACAQVVASGGWVRPPPPGAPTAVAYVVLTNRGAAPDALLGGETPAARAVQMHSMSMAGGIMRMRRLDALPLPPGTAVSLAPAGAHLMLVGLKGAPKPGARVAVTLRFRRSPPLRLALPVRPDAPAQP